MRWGLAIAAVYFYNTSPIFADEVAPQVGTAPTPFSDADQPTIDALIEEKRKHVKAAAPPPPPPKAPAETLDAADAAAAPTATAETDNATTGAPAPAPAPGSPEALEQEAEQQGAFNPETGEINWDCPCLGGMADGPCGEEFKAAFSCFVYSTEEPKGMDCIDKFQHMQDCFRKYPEIYGAEIADEEDGEVPALADDSALAKAVSESTQDSSEQTPEPVKPVAAVAEALEGGIQKLREEKPKEEKPQEETVIPEQAHDATQANKGKQQ